MSKFWSEVIRRLQPYIPGEQPQGRTYVKLNTNENPYPPSPAVTKVLRDFPVEGLRRYPDPNSNALKCCLADWYRVTPDQVFVGNGSDEVLALAFKAFFVQSAPILFPDVTYSFYGVYCQLFDIQYRAIPLDTQYAIQVEDYASRNGGIAIANPNAPTGLGLRKAEVVALLQANSDSVVLIDEAYVDFGGESALELIDSFPNLLVVQTLSKSRSLAGLRLGYAFGHPTLIEGLNRVKNSFNCFPIDSITNACAIAALEDRSYFETCRQKIINDRTWLIQELVDRGYEVLPSQTNFVFTSHPGIDGEALYKGLKERGVLVRYFAKSRIKNFVRITIGTREELTALLANLPT